MGPQLTAGATVGDVTSGSGSSTLASSEGPIIQDLLVLCTAASAPRYGQPALENMVRSAVESANQAYANSQAELSLNLVGLQQTGLVEGSNIDATVDKLQASAPLT